jgi:hypothetical protein
LTAVINGFRVTSSVADMADGFDHARGDLNIGYPGARPW